MRDKKAKRSGGRPKTGRDHKTLVGFCEEVAAYLVAEKERTGKAKNRILEDLLRGQMALKPDARAY